MELINEILKYLEQFIKQSDCWDNHYARQTRAIFTTLCLIGNIDADTKVCDDILSRLYEMRVSACETEETYEDFENFMLELIV